MRAESVGVRGHTNAIRALVASMLLLASGSALAAPIMADEKSPTYTDVPGQIRALQATPTSGKIQGTYSTKHLFDTYSAGIHHVQGIAELSDGRYVLSHNVRADREALIVVSTGEQDTAMIKLQMGDHPGGIQATGKVIAVPVKGGDIPEGESRLFLVDARNKDVPIWQTLMHMTKNIPGDLNAVGIAYVAQLDQHVLVTTTITDYGSGGTVNLFKSKAGASLFDPTNTWTFVCKLATDKGLISSQGGTQLIVDKNGDVFIAALYRTTAGKEMITLSQIFELTSPKPYAQQVLTKTLSDSGGVDDYSAGFRWGGTLARDPAGHLSAVGVARTLTNGPAEQFARTRIWKR